MAAENITVAYDMCAHGSYVTVQAAPTLLDRIFPRTEGTTTIAKVCSRPACVAEAKGWIARATGRRAQAIYPEPAPQPPAGSYAAITAASGSLHALTAAPRR